MAAASLAVVTGRAAVCAVATSGAAGAAVAGAAAAAVSAVTFFLTAILFALTEELDAGISNALVYSYISLPV